MGNVVRTGRFEEKRRDAVYQDLVETLMGDGFDYDEIEDVREEVYETCEIGDDYMLDNKGFPGVVRAVSWKRTDEEAADVTIFYRNATAKKFKGVEL